MYKGNSVTAIMQNSIKNTKTNCSVLYLRELSWYGSRMQSPRLIPGQIPQSSRR